MSQRSGRGKKRRKEDSKVEATPICHRGHVPPTWSIRPTPASTENFSSRRPLKSQQQPRSHARGTRKDDGQAV